MAKQIDYTKIRPDIVRRKQLKVNPVFAVKQLQRLQDVLADETGELTVACRFYQSELGLQLMDLAINGQVTVQCKRCLAPFVYNWDSVNTLQLDAEDVLNQDAVDEQYERVALAHDKSFNLMDVVEDEILLGLPERHLNICPDVPELNYVN